MTTTTKTFRAQNGVPDVWTCPPNILGRVAFTCVGAAGGYGQGSNFPGGAGGQIYGKVLMAPGDAVSATVGVQGQPGSGGGGAGVLPGADGGTGLGDGGGGGSASTVQAATVFDSYTVGQHILTAGGGGGGGGTGGSGSAIKYVTGRYAGQGGDGGGILNAGEFGFNPALSQPAGTGAAANGTGGAADISGGGGGYAGTSASGSTPGAGGAGATGVGGGGGGGGGGWTHAGGGGGGSAAGDSGGGGSGGASYGATGVTSVQYTDANNPHDDGTITVTYTVVDAPLVVNQLPANNSTVDVWNDGVTFQWLYEPQTDSGTQIWVALRIQTLGGQYLWWGGSAFDKTAEFFLMPYTTFDLTVPAHVLQNAGVYAWSVRCVESLAEVESQYSPDWIFVSPAAPVVTIATPSGYTSILPPVVSWSEVLTQDTSITPVVQTGYRVLVYEQGTTLASGFELPFTPSGSAFAGTLYDSGLVSGTDLICYTDPWPYVQQNIYVAFVLVVETNGVMSNWASSLFIADHLAPTAPSLCVVDPNGNNVRYILVTGNDTNDLVGQCTAEVDVSTNGGATWGLVADGLAMSAGQMCSVEDSAGGSSTGRIYRAILKSPAYDLTTSASAVTSSVTVGGLNFPKLSDPAVPNSAIPVWISKFDAADRPIDQGIFQGIGNAEDLVLSDVRRLRTGSMTLVTQNNALRDVIISMLSDSRLLRLTRPPNDPNAAGDSLWFVETGPITEDKLTAVNRGVPQRTLKFAFSEQLA